MLDVAGKKLIVREYLRVSHDPKAEQARDAGRARRSKSEDQQHEENVAAIERMDWKAHPKPYEDTNRSASRSARRRREGFEELLADLQNGSFGADALALWESSRGSRQVGEWVELVGLCEEHGVLIWVTTHGRLYDPSNPRDRRSMLEDAVDSEYESAKMSKRIKRDMAAAAKEGLPHGKNIYGYQRIYDEKTRDLLEVVPHPEQAPVVQEAARRVLAGESHYAIAKSLNQRGIPQRRVAYREHRKHQGWTSVAIRQMLEMPAYAGLRQFRGEVVGTAKWEPLIEPDDWEKIQSMFRASSSANKRDWVAKHLLTGIATCSVCGMIMRMGKQNKGRRQPLFDHQGKPVLHTSGRFKGQQKKTGEHYYTYVCGGVAGKPRPGEKSVGFHVAIKSEHLDLMVTEAILARLSRKDFLASVGQRGKGVDKERAALQAQLTGYREYLEAVREQAAEQLRFDLLVDQEARIMPKIKEAQNRLEALADVDPVVLRLASSLDLRGAWEQMDVETRRRVIRALVVPVVSRAAKRGQRGLDFDRVELVWK